MKQEFTVRAAADPQSLPRVMGHLARQWITPVKMCAEKVDDELRITFVTDDLLPEKAMIIAALLRSSVLVHAVDLQAEVGVQPAR